jgi:hypothetical protein
MIARQRIHEGMAESYMHLMSHKTRLTFDWATFKWDVECDCDAHYAHYKFPFTKLKDALAFYCTW